MNHGMLEAYLFTVVGRLVVEPHPRRRAVAADVLLPSLLYIPLRRYSCRGYSCPACVRA